MIRYIIIINVIAFISMGLDKYYAKKNKWRISEMTLFFLAIILGSVGSILGMKYFHHKTKKKKFIIFMPLILIIQIYIFLNLYK